VIRAMPPSPQCHGRARPFCPERHAALPAPGMIAKDLPLISGKSFAKGKSFAIMAPPAGAHGPQAPCGPYASGTQHLKRALPRSRAELPHQQARRPAAGRRRSPGTARAATSHRHFALKPVALPQSCSWANGVARSRERAGVRGG